MVNEILSVTIDELMQKTWNMLNDNGDNLEAFVEIYNNLSNCRNDIETCETEKDYLNIEKRVRNCEYKIIKLRNK